MAVQQGICTNFGNCDKADHKEIQIIAAGREPVCSLCFHKMTVLAGEKPSIPWTNLAVTLGGLILLAVTGVVIVNFFHNNPGGPLISAPAKVEGPQGLLGRPLRVGIVQWPGYAGGIVANNGFAPNKSEDCLFWHRHNLLVEFVDLEDPDAANKAFAKGGPDGVDIVWSTVDYFANQNVGLKKNGTNARAIMQVDWSQGGDAIVADSSIQKIEDLAGKKIALVQFTPSHWLLEYNIQNSSLSDDAQKQIVTNLVNSGSEEDARDAFVANRVPAVVIWEPFVSDALKKRPGSHILVSSAFAPNLIADVMIAQDSFIHDHPEVLRAFVAGWLEGATEATRRPDKAAKILMDNEPAYKQAGEDATRDGLTKVRLANIQENTRMFGLDGSKPDFNRIFNTASDAWLRRGYISSKLTPDDSKDAQFVKAVYDQNPVSLTENSVRKEDINKTKPLLTKQVRIQFATGASDLDSNAKNYLEDQVISLAKSFSNSYLHIEGNTDNVGDPNANRTLSKRRAESVLRFLISRGISRNQLAAKGNGPDKPVADNATEDGRAKNRRTDIEVRH